MRTFNSGDRDFYAVKGTEADGSWFLCNLTPETEVDSEITLDYTEAYSVREEMAKLFPEVTYTVVHVDVAL